MKTTSLLLGTSVGLILMAGSAMAGPCSMEIATLEKTLGSTDAGMGPTGTNAIGAAVTPGTVTAAPASPTTPATGAMNDAAAGKATSAQDVQSQNVGEPTAADAAGAGQMNTAAGNADVMTSLQKAKDLDQAGKESACMDEVAKAKQLLGAQ